MSSYVEDVVLDPFLGSGSTTLAAMETSRSSIGFEIEEKYWKTAKARLGAQSLFEKATVKFERSPK